MTTFPRRFVESHVSLASAELFMLRKLNTCRIMFARTEPKRVSLCRKKGSVCSSPISVLQDTDFTGSTSVPFLFGQNQSSSIHFIVKGSIGFCGRKLLFHIIPVGNWKHLRFFFSKTWFSQKVLVSFLICKKILDFLVATTLHPTPKPAF